MEEHLTFINIKLLDQKQKTNKTFRFQTKK
jgi:hypothetical protein